MKKFFSDFKAFITKGNILDLAIAVVIGGAFGKIVTSLVNHIIMPLLSVIMGGLNVSDLKYVLKPERLNDAGETLAEVAVMYGEFLQSIIDFLIIAFFIFLALRILMKVQSGFGEFKELNKKERRVFVKEQKAQGKTRQEIKIALTERENAEIERQKAEAEAKKQEEEANKPETSEQILSDIRTLLIAQNTDVLNKTDSDK